MPKLTSEERMQMLREIADSTGSLEATLRRAMEIRQKINAARNREGANPRNLGCE